MLVTTILIKMAAFYQCHEHTVGHDRHNWYHNDDYYDDDTGNVLNDDLL